MTIPMRSWTAAAALLSVAAVATADLSYTGNITLFSDTTCSDPIFINSWTLGRDVCAKVDNGPWPADKPFRSYILNERPYCTNGTFPYLNVYRDEACAELIESTSYEPKGPDADGMCMVPRGDYKAMAFVCDGFEGAWGSQNAAPAVSSAVEEPEETWTVASVSSTPAVVASVSSGPDTASISSTRSSTSDVQATPMASITPSATNGTATASFSAPTSAFTGAGSILRTHFQAVVFGVSLIILLAQ
jgi:hypothetical protein